MSRVADVLGAVAARVDAAADELNRLDGQAGDGDLGVTMRMAARVVVELLPEIEGAELPDALRSCGGALARGAPSTAGTLVATGFLRAAKAAGTAEGTAAARLATLLEAAATGIAERGKAAVGSKTMLDALLPAAEAARAAADGGGGVAEVLARAAEAADAGARATAEMRAVHGRAGWLAERSAGHEDAGARLVAIALRAAADAVDAGASQAATAASLRQDSPSGSSRA